MRLENIYVSVQFQGHRAKVKVTASKYVGAQVCAPLRDSLMSSYMGVYGSFHRVYVIENTGHSASVIVTSYNTDHYHHHNQTASQWGHSDREGGNMSGFRHRTLSLTFVSADLLSYVR